MAHIETCNWYIDPSILLDKAQGAVGELLASIGSLSHQAFVQVYPGMIATVVAQQLSDKSYQSLLSKLPEELFDYHIAMPDQLQLPLSQSKISTIRTLQELFVTGKLSESSLRSWDPVLRAERLLLIKGIGPWSVQMMEMLVFHNEDVFSVHDWGLQSAVLHLAGKSRQSLSNQEILALMERYYKVIAPWHKSSLVSFALWELNRLPPERKDQLFGIWEGS